MSTNLNNAHICGKPLDECLQIVERFHGWKAPGLVLGLFMVDRARRLIGADVEADAIVETRHCLPDAIQLFTPCTVGNGWMKILDWDKFALTLYDRWNFNGYRVWLDLDKAKRYPDLYKWYLRLVSKKDLPLDILLDSILTAGGSVLSSCAVSLVRLGKRQKKGATAVCPDCKEAFDARQGSKCLACQGAAYYRVFDERLETYSESERVQWPCTSRLNWRRRSV